jgi:hypothetical protein
MVVLGVLKDLLHRRRRHRDALLLKVIRAAALFRVVITVPILVVNQTVPNLTSPFNFLIDGLRSAVS